MKNKILILSIIILPLMIYSVLSYIDAKNQPIAPIEDMVYASPDYIDRVTIYKFYSPMCSDCLKQNEEINKIDEKYKKYYLLENINVSDRKHNSKNVQEYIDKFEIVTVPTIIITNSDGEIIRKYVGYTSVDKIHEGIEANK